MNKINALICDNNLNQEFPQVFHGNYHLFIYMITFSGKSSPII